MIQNLNYNTRVLERMVCQNTWNDLLFDFRYWDDPSDRYREHGRLYPLWRMKTLEIGQRSIPVSGLRWSQRYSDLLYVSYGSVKQCDQSKGGAILLFTLKRPNYPEHTLLTELPVIDIDVHPELPHLICAGFSNGSVAVYAVRKEETHSLEITTIDNQLTLYSNGRQRWNDKKSGWTLAAPIARYWYRPQTVNAIHHGPCLKVCWCKDENRWTILSFGSDGKVVQWSFDKDKLAPKESTQLQVAAQTSQNGPGNERCGASLEPNVAGSLSKIEELGDAVTFSVQKSPQICADYGKSRKVYKEESHEDHKRLAVGTVTGAIMVFSNCTSSQPEYGWLTAHSTAVSCLAWNPVVPEILASSSYDWTGKLWTPRVKDSLLTLDLFTSVEDMAWSPFSSSVLGVLTSSGTVLIFDLIWSTVHAIASHQLVAQRTPVTGSRIEFHPWLCLLIVGDYRGDVLHLKLSPNVCRRRGLNDSPVNTENKFSMIEEDTEKLKRFLGLKPKRER